jgi:hypothetical protein
MGGERTKRVKGGKMREKQEKEVNMSSVTVR